MRRLFFSLATLTALSAWPGSAPAAPYQDIEKTAEICANAVQAMERRSAIPRHLLSAIALTESGRWRPERQANVAWPWTVSNGGAGRFFETKAEAVAEVEFLLTAGERNIDVGCMQINLRAHADAFETLADSFEPERNVAYGADYLKRMFQSTGDWLSAAGAYHSTTPTPNARYRAKIQHYWDQLRGRPAATNTDATPVVKPPAQIDHARTEALNKAFRSRRADRLSAEDRANPKAVFSAFRQTQMDAWRQQKDAGLRLSMLADMRRAELAQRRKKQYAGPSKAEKREQLADRRRQQLDDWRRHIVHAAMTGEN